MDNSLSFKNLCIVASGVTAALFVTLLLWPAVIHWLFLIDSNQAADVMSRRAAMLFAGLSLIVWQARIAPDSPLRRGICHGIAIAMTGLAFLGLFDYLRGSVGIGIWLAIITEVAFAAGFTWFGRSES